MLSIDRLIHSALSLITPHEGGGHSVAMSNGTQARAGPTRQRILKCAEHLFALQGYNGTSTRQIAKEAGISIQTLHYHCGGKKNLYRTVMERSIMSVTDLINGHVQKMLCTDLNDSRVLEESVTSIIEDLFNVLHTHPDYALLFYRQWLVSDPELRSVEWERLVPILLQWTHEIERQLDKRRLRGMNLFLFFLSLGWIYWGLFVQPAFIASYLGMNPRSPEFLACLKDHAREMTLRMMQQRESSRGSSGKTIRTQRRQRTPLAARKIT